jgi:microcystin-dependent protein
MAQTYGQIKKMKTAKIGTIMPWAGDGNDGTLLSNVPTGWILCDGRVYQASRYPLLSSVLGNSYGGTSITGDFPHYTGTIKIPDLTGRVMMDLEPSMLFDSKYQYGQSDAYNQLVDTNSLPLVVDDGFTKSIPTLISSDTNLVFTLNSDLAFIGKMTGGTGQTNITITNPAFTTTIYTIGRKLGINHMPYHKHPGDYSTAVGGSAAPELFRPSPFQVGGSKSTGGGCPSKSWYEATLTDVANAPTWCNGKGAITYYDDSTLVETSQFNEFISTASQDYTQIPATTAGNINYESPSAYTNGFSAAPIKTHAMKAWTGYYPKPMIFFGRRNFFGYNTGYIGPTGIQDDPENKPAFVKNLSISALATTITIPASNNSIGNNFDSIVPFMFVTSNLQDTVYIAKGTQILNITRTGETPETYAYEIELSQNIGGSGTKNVDVSFRHGAYPTSMNTVPAGQDPAGNTFGSHNHGTFELIMGEGLKGPTTHPVNDVSKGDINPNPINGALNILANVANPSLNIVYIIRAY